MTYALPIPLDLACNWDGRSNWCGGGWYRGCVEDTSDLTFDHLTDEDVLNLFWQSHTIENTILTCEDMNTHVITIHDVPLYLGESLIECGGIIYYTMYVILKYIYLQINCGNFNENDWSRLVLNYNFAAYLSLLIKDPRPTTLQSTENSEPLYLVSKPFDLIYIIGTVLWIDDGHLTSTTFLNQQPTKMEGELACLTSNNEKLLHHKSDNMKRICKGYSEWQYRFDSRQWQIIVNIGLNR